MHWQLLWKELPWLKLVAACAEKRVIKSALNLYVPRYAIAGVVSLGQAVSLAFLFIFNTTKWRFYKESSITFRTQSRVGTVWKMSDVLFAEQIYFGQLMRRAT